MATMASTSHGLSVWANSCIKNPIDSKSGLTKSLKERTPGDYHDSLQGTSGLHVHFDHERDRNQNHFRTSIDELQAAKEEEFFDKLQQLKSENKKTLEAYERLYKDQMIMNGTRRSQTDIFQYDKSGIDREIDPGVEGLVVNGHSQDVDANLSFKKPPSGKTNIHSMENPIPSVSNPMLSRHSTRKQRPSSAPMERSQSLDDENWHDLLDPSKFADDDYGDYILVPKESLGNDYRNAQAKINSMWEDFNIPEAIERRHSFSSSNKHKKTSIDRKEMEKQKGKEWRHRITVPEPFQMSIRDSLKEKKKTTAQQELEERRIEKQKEEEAECEKKFKAQPAPSHIYIPLYEEIMEKNNSRRKHVREYCQELLKSQVKPFNFEVREKEKHHQKVLMTSQKPPQKTKKPAFRATPVPKTVFDHKIDDKLNEDEELRKIRIRMRAKELLRDSSLPPNMAEREKLKEQDRKEKARKAKLAAKKQRPRSAHAIPDYDALYREFHKEIAQRKSVKEATVVQPFQMETSHIRSSRERINRDIENDEKSLKENRWPYSSSRETPRSSMKYLGALSTSMDSIPTISTKAADLRNIKIKKEKERIQSRELQDDEAETRRRAREAKLRRYLNERTCSDDVPKPKESIAARLKRIKQEDRERQETYQRELTEMKDRVDASPLLVEKFMKENAKKEAEKKFNNTVKGAGFDGIDIINSHRAASVRSGDGYVSGSDEDQYARKADVTYTRADSEEQLYSEEDYE